MPVKIPNLAVAAALAALAAAAPARAQPSPAPPVPTAAGAETPASAARDTRLKLRTPIETYFSSNLFHVQNRRVDSFVATSDPASRFFGMNALWDIVLRPSARAAMEVPLGRKRDLEVGIGADYYLHQQNGIADYLRLLAAGACDLTRHDKVDVEAKLAPRRFEKNHRVPAPVNPALGAAKDSYPFEHAYASELDLVASYDHEWSRTIASRLEYRLARTAYDDPFRNRDGLLNEGRAALVLDVGRRSRVEIVGGFGLSRSPGEREMSYKYDPTAYPAGIVVDRSFHETVLQAKAHLAAWPATTIEAGVGFRDRSFTTGVSADLLHHQRSDQLYRAEIAIDRKVGSGFTLGAFASLALDSSDRSDPNLTPDEAGYKELVLGGALSWRYSTGRE